MLPRSSDPPIRTRLVPKDYAFAKRLAAQKGMPLSTWMRMVIIEKLQQEREHGK